jgi:hypothetical protein
LRYVSQTPNFLISLLQKVGFFTLSTFSAVGGPGSSVGRMNQQPSKGPFAFKAEYHLAQPSFRHLITVMYTRFGLFCIQP